MKKTITLLALTIFVVSGLAFAAQSADLTGTWEGPLPVADAGIELFMTLEVQHSGDEITGKINDDQGYIDCEITDALLDGKTFTFMAIANTPDGDYDLTFTMTVEGDTMTGSWETDGMSGEWEAERQK